MSQISSYLIRCPITIQVRPLVKSVTKNKLSCFSTKTYIVGTQKNRLDETVLLSTHIICLNW